MKIKRKIIRIAESSGIVIPKSICELLELKNGDLIEITLNKCKGVKKQ